MAYQKLQVERALKVIKSDTINIPNVAGASTSGTTDGATTTDKLIDSTAAFTSNLLNYIVYNTTDSTVARVTAVDDANTLTLSANIMPSGKEYTIYEDNNTGCVLYNGTGGLADIKVMTSGGDVVTFSSVSSGAFIPVQVIRLLSSGTSASNVIAMW